jgi:hypothetical protein
MKRDWLITFQLHDKIMNGRFGCAAVYLKQHMLGSFRYNDHLFCCCVIDLRLIHQPMSTHLSLSAADAAAAAIATNQ